MKQHHMNTLVEEKDNMKIKVIKMKKMFLFHLNIIEISLGALYKPFTVEDINRKMAEMLRPVGMKAPVEFVFQTIEGLHAACPDHQGDWYFTGQYPTPGGNKLVNEAFVNYVEQNLKLQK